MRSRFAAALAGILVAGSGQAQDTRFALLQYGFIIAAERPCGLKLDRNGLNAFLDSHSTTDSAADLAAVKEGVRSTEARLAAADDASRGAICETATSAARLYRLLR